MWTCQQIGMLIFTLVRTRGQVRNEPLRIQGRRHQGSLRQVPGSPHGGRTKEPEFRGRQVGAEAWPQAAREGRHRGYFDPAVRKQLAIMAVKRIAVPGRVLAEALNLLFERYGEPPIATVITSDEPYR